MGAEEWQSYLELIDQQLSSIEVEDDDQWEDIEDDEEEGREGRAHSSWSAGYRKCKSVNPL